MSIFDKMGPFSYLFIKNDFKKCFLDSFRTILLKQTMLYPMGRSTITQNTEQQFRLKETNMGNDVKLFYFMMQAVNNLEYTDDIDILI